MHVELIESVARTLWAFDDRGRHHIGVWTDDVEEEAARMASLSAV